MVRFNEDRMPLNGESMAVSHDDVALSAYDAGKEAERKAHDARDRREERIWRGLALVAAGLFIWATFNVAWAIDDHAAMIGVKVRAFVPNKEGE